MLYLSSFVFPNEDQEWAFAMSVKRKCYTSFYPFQVLSSRGLMRLDFSPVTILCGGNGCGKSTALNVMAEKLGAARDTLYNRSSFFEDYTALCREEMQGRAPDETRIITSDDVFDFMLNLRAANEGIDRRREELFAEWVQHRDIRTPDDRFRLRSLEDYDRLKQVNQAWHSTQSMYVKKNMPANVREHSNGESAFLYFADKLRDNGLYLLDEPENSLSPEKQLELKELLENQVRFFGCQLVIATHSPILLSLRGARIYDLSGEQAEVRKWTDIGGVRAWFEFFSAHEQEFRR